jgi:hypothetical protein
MSKETPIALYKAEFESPNIGLFFEWFPTYEEAAARRLKQMKGKDLSPVRITLTEIPTNMADLCEWLNLNACVEF